MKNLFYLLLATSVLTEQSVHGEAPKKNKQAKKNKSKGKSKNNKSKNGKKSAGGSSKSTSPITTTPAKTPTIISTSNNEIINFIEKNKDLKINFKELNDLAKNFITDTKKRLIEENKSFIVREIKIDEIQLLLKNYIENKKTIKSEIIKKYFNIIKEENIDKKSFKETMQKLIIFYNEKLKNNEKLKKNENTKKEEIIKIFDTIKKGSDLEKYLLLEMEYYLGIAKIEKIEESYTIEDKKIDNLLMHIDRLIKKNNQNKINEDNIYTKILREIESYLKEYKSTRKISEIKNIFNIINAINKDTPAIEIFGAINTDKELKLQNELINKKNNEEINNIKRELEKKNKQTKKKISQIETKNKRLGEKDGKQKERKNKKSNDGSNFEIGDLFDSEETKEIKNKIIFQNINILKKNIGDKKILENIDVFFNKLITDMTNKKKIEKVLLLTFMNTNQIHPDKLLTSENKELANKIIYEIDSYNDSLKEKKPILAITHTSKEEFAEAIKIASQIKDSSEKQLKIKQLEEAYKKAEKEFNDNNTWSGMIYGNDPQKRKAANEEIKKINIEIQKLKKSEDMEESFYDIEDEK